MTFGAFAVYVGFPISEFIFLKLEKAAEFFILSPSCRNIAGKDPKEHIDHQRRGGKQIDHVQKRSFHKQRQDHGQQYSGL